MANSAYISKDQNHQDETTVYWFEISSLTGYHEDGTYGIADCNGEKTYVDSDGCPITDNLHEFKYLMIITDEMIND